VILLLLLKGRGLMEDQPIGCLSGGEGGSGEGVVGKRSGRGGSEAAQERVVGWSVVLVLEFPDDFPELAEGILEEGNERRRERSASAAGEFVQVFVATHPRQLIESLLLRAQPVQPRRELEPHFLVVQPVHLEEPVQPNPQHVASPRRCQLLRSSQIHSVGFLSPATPLEPSHQQSAEREGRDVGPVDEEKVEPDLEVEVEGDLSDPTFDGRGFERPSRLDEGGRRGRSGKRVPWCEIDGRWVGRGRSGGRSGASSFRDGLGLREDGDFPDDESRIVSWRDGFEVGVGISSIFLEDVEDLSSEGLLLHLRRSRWWCLRREGNLRRVLS